MSDRARLLVEAVITALVRRDWETLLANRWIEGSEGFARVLDEYGAAFSPGPPPVLDDTIHVAQLGPHESRWRIDHALWSEDEGWTDLYAVLFVDERGADVTAELYDLLVP